MKRLGFPFAASSLIVCVVVASADAFYNPDQFRCYKVKDTVAKNTYTLEPGTSLSSLTVPVLDESNCTVKTPAKMGCFPVMAFNGGATPPPGPFYSGALPVNMPLLCYQTKCDKADVKSLPPINGLRDTYGTHNGLTVSAQSKLVCAPACAALGSPCVSYLDTSCCSGACDVSNTCVCVANGAACDEASDCCSGTCGLSNSCCIASGSACAAPGPDVTCCSGTCGAGSTCD
jgi:hypothetical protein